MNELRGKTEEAREGEGGSDRRNQDRGINDGAQRIVDERKVGTSRLRQERTRYERKGGGFGRWRQRQSLVTGDTRMCRRCTRASTVRHSTAMLHPQAGRKTRVPQYQTYVNGSR